MPGSWARRRPGRRPLGVHAGVTWLGRDFEILPAVAGKERFLGTNVGITTNTVHGAQWWGEAEVKMYINGDAELPTLVGTGTEDYIGTSWGQGRFMHRFQGCSIADPEKPSTLGRPESNLPALARAAERMAGLITADSD